MYSTYLNWSDRSVSQSTLTSRRVEKLKENLTNIMDQKVSEALEYTSKASIYNPEETISELTTAQTYVLVLFYGLRFGDLRLCQYVAQAQVQQLKSSFLRVWLADDFAFKNQEVMSVLAMLSYLLAKKVIIEDHILRIFGGLVQKYQAADCCSENLLDVFNDEQVEKGGEQQNEYEEKKCSQNLNQYITDAKVKEGEDQQNEDEEKKSQNLNQDMTDAKKTKNGSRTAFSRIGSIRSWFQRKKEEGTKKVEEEFYVISKDETTCDSDYSACDNDENISHCSEFTEGASAVQYERINVSETTEQEENYEDVDGDGRTILHRLAQHGLRDRILRVFGDRANIDTPDFSGKTALHWAVEYNRYSTVELLLKAGADVNARTFERKTPLSYACHENGVMSDTWRIIVGYNGIM